MITNDKPDLETGIKDLVGDDPGQASKPRLRRYKKRTKAQLEHKLAAWRDRYQDVWDGYARHALSLHNWWEALSEYDKECQRNLWKKPRFFPPTGLDYGPHLYPHPQSPEGKAMISDHWLLETYRGEIVKLERLLNVEGRDDE